MSYFSTITYDLCADEFSFDYKPINATQNCLVAIENEKSSPAVISLNEKSQMVIDNIEEDKDERKDVSILCTPRVNYNQATSKGKIFILHSR